MVPIKLDANGDPVIHSMRPEDPDPWNGQIVSFDLTLLLAIELSDVMPDPQNEDDYVLKLRTLADRSRLIITPIEGTSATTIPPRKLISNLADQLMTALAQFSPKENAISFSVPDHMAFESDMDDGSLFSAVGLRRIDLGPRGLELGFDEKQNRLSAALSAIITQVLHIDGEEVTFLLPE